MTTKFKWKSGALENATPSRLQDNCPRATKLSAAPARSAGLYNDLSKDEIIAERDYILRQPSLRLTSYENGALNENYIFLIELKQPPKDKALDFLDHENAPKPERTTRAGIYNGGKKPPTVSEYLVSPAGNPIQISRTRGPWHKYCIPFELRVVDGKESYVTERLVSNTAKQSTSFCRKAMMGTQTLAAWIAV